LVLQAQYAEALHTIRTTLAEMTDYGLAFGVPHVEWALAAAELGLRHFARCDAVLLRIERRLLQTPDHHLDLNTRALRARLHLAQQRCAEALNVVSEEFDIQSGPSMYGEYLATRALAFAVAGQVGEAEAAARRAVSRTDAVEAGLIAAATRAIVEVRTSESRNDASALLLEHASRINAWDGVICAVRAYPLLLPRLMSVNRSGNELREALLRSKDVALAKAVGLVTRSTGHGVLSPREREIMEYVRQGQRNADIATSLFISRGTVKSHLDHIFDKLGVRSRTGAVMRYAEIENVATDESVGS
jgi:DNA-binding CsgD family transcriptional regulator